MRERVASTYMMFLTKVVGNIRFCRPLVHDNYFLDS